MNNQTPAYSPKDESIPKVYGSMPPLGEQETVDSISKYNPEQDVMCELYACEIDLDVPEYDPEQDDVCYEYGSEIGLDMPEYDPRQDEMCDEYGCEIDLDEFYKHNDLGAEKND